MRSAVEGFAGEAPGGTAEGLDAMAETFAWEFLRMGFSPDAVLALFKNPFYRAPNHIYRARGEAWVAALIRRIANGGEELHAEA